MPVRRTLPVAIALAIGAYALYHATLLPGVDFGDTGSFQATVGVPDITPRDGYPLYFAIGSQFVRFVHAEPAYALNLASAVEAAIACGLTVLVAAEVSGSIAAALGAALLLAVSYTFWSQAVIAEVYALHLIFVALTLLLLLRWQREPTLPRLTLFFAVYALGFGNHLSMILLAPAYAAFLLLAAPGGWRTMLRPQVVGVACACAVAGALQYAWNLKTLWLLPQPPHGTLDALRTFWFDVTKSDWRDTMVLRVPPSMLADHLAMYGFDLRQQFGLIGPALALAGLVRLCVVEWRRSLLLALLYAIDVAFAYSYDVGDAHVFYLPSHFVVAVLAASGVALARRVSPRAVTAAGLLLAAYAGIRGYRDFPALDRSADRRPAEVLQSLTSGLDDRHAVLLADLNWQVQNGLAYFAKADRPELAYGSMSDALLYAPALVADNRAIGRDVVLTGRARDEVAAAYGPLLPALPDPRAAVPPLADAVRGLPTGTRYVLCVLRPSRDTALDAADLGAALSTLGAPARVPEDDYAAIAGRLGAPPRLVVSSMRPFRRDLSLDGVDVEIRMEAWLASDTIRRMGFGHVIAHRRHTLIVERGVSFAAFDEQGRAIRTAYRSNIFAPQPRYLISASP